MRAKFKPSLINSLIKVKALTKFWTVNRNALVTPVLSFMSNNYEKKNEP